MKLHMHNCDCLILGFGNERGNERIPERTIYVVSRSRPFFIGRLSITKEIISARSERALIISNR